MTRLYQTLPAFLPSEAGDLFVLRFVPRSPRGTVILVPPFAEEMNRCRHMVSRQARRLADIGIASTLFDLAGTGDSSGSFADASWEAWRSNLVSVIRDEEARSDRPVWLLGVRLGALLALDVLRSQNSSVAGTVLWNPVVSGSMHMTQFLRLRLLGAMMRSEATKETLKDLRAKLESEGSLEVAGYLLTQQLVESIGQLKLAELLPADKRVLWIELSNTEGQSLPLPAAKLATSMTESNADFVLRTVVGPTFWATQELTLAPALLEVTGEELDRCL